ILTPRLRPLIRVTLRARLRIGIIVIERVREESLWQNGTHREARCWNAAYNGVCCSKALKPDECKLRSQVLVYIVLAAMLPIHWFHQCRCNAMSQPCPPSPWSHDSVCRQLCGNCRPRACANRAVPLVTASCRQLLQ